LRQVSGRKGVNKNGGNKLWGYLNGLTKKSKSLLL